MSVFCGNEAEEIELRLKKEKRVTSSMAINTSTSSNCCSCTKHILYRMRLYWSAPWITNLSSVQGTSPGLQTSMRKHPKDKEQTRPLGSWSQFWTQLKKTPWGMWTVPRPLTAETSLVKRLIWYVKECLLAVLICENHIVVNGCAHLAPERWNRGASHIL